MGAYSTINPVTGELVAEFPELGDEEARSLIDLAADAYKDWKNVQLDERAALLRRIANIHREQAQELASGITVEMGKPISQSLGEIKIVADIYDYYADHAAEFLADQELSISGPGTAIVRTEPIGVLVGIMPWNFPYYQVARFVAPNLVLGNTIILKHARNCPQSALAIERIIREAGAPDGAYVNAFVSNQQIAEMIADPRIQGVSLTGSERAGSAIGEIAGRHMKKYVLELGGSDPFIVLEDADIDEAAAAAVIGRMSNAGQACTSSKRMIVVDSVYESFVNKFVEGMRNYRAGEPSDPETVLGPLSSAAARADFAVLVDDAIDKGAQVLTGGTLAQGKGAFYPATVLAEVTPDMRAYSEELFGPAAVVYRVASAEEAVELANSSPYGLSSTIFTTDTERALRIAESIESGMVWINSTSKSAPDLPFGGVKASGVGRELARFGIDEFANKKLIRVPGLAPAS